MLLLLAASAVSSTTPFVIALVAAFISSGGIWYFIDRRSVQASRLAEQASNATGVFTKALEEERRHRKELEMNLSSAQGELTQALDQAKSNAHLIDSLHNRIAGLERDLMHSLQDMNEIVKRMFTNGHTHEYMIERWRAIMQATEMAVIQADRDGRIVFVSPEAKVLLGYRDLELVGLSLIHLIPDEDRELYMSAMLKSDEGVPPLKIGMRQANGDRIQVAMALAAHGQTVTIILREWTDDVEALAQSGAFKEHVGELSR